MGDERVNQARIKHIAPLSEPNSSLTRSESHPIPAVVRLGRHFVIAGSYSLEAIQLPRLLYAVASLPVSRAGGRDFGGSRAMPNFSAAQVFKAPGKCLNGFQFHVRRAAAASLANCSCYFL